MMPAHFRRSRVDIVCQGRAHAELQEAIDLHQAIVAEASNALIGYETEKTLANVVLLSEIPTTYDKDEKRQVNAGNLLLRGVPGVG
jgi:predicted ATP-grasp superfamily ATP-dependent carboligase